MMPIGPLMKEHRKIERMVALIANEAQRLGADQAARPSLEFIEAALIFMREYADECHHGKEEDILFAELGQREISDEHRGIMERLLADHTRGRALMAQLDDAARRSGKGDTEARAEIVEAMQGVADLYPDHIRTEDKQFFIPAMDYLDNEEKEDMMEEMWDFDHDLFTGLYEGCITEFESDED